MATSLETRPSTAELVAQFRQTRPTRSVGSLALWLLFLSAIGLGGWKLIGQSLVGGSAGSSKPSGVLTHTVSKGRLLITVLDDGNVESSRNQDIKCQVAGGSNILWIVQDGKEVEEDEILVELDRSSLTESLNAQKINFEKARAMRIQAEKDLEAAIIGVKEYAEGIFVKELQLSDATISIAQENLRSSENLLEHTRKMSRKGFTTALQVEADEFAVERSKLELDSAKTAKRVLQDFTSQKVLKELEAKRDAAVAKVAAEQAAFQLEDDRRERLEKQLANCTIKAPRKGMVVYANESSSGRFGSGSSPRVEEGAMIRESQTILRLPDLSAMQVKVTVHESKVERLKRGMPARITIQDKDQKGHIINIANQPEQSSMWGANIKEYATTVKIDGESEGLKPGMTAEVEILVDDLTDVLTVPVSCVVEQGGKLYAWAVVSEGKYERRPLVVGQTNDKMFEIQDGLKEGDVVLMNPRAIVDEARQVEQKHVPQDVDAKEKFGTADFNLDQGNPKTAGDGKRSFGDGASGDANSDRGGGAKSAAGKTRRGPPGGKNRPPQDGDTSPAGAGSGGQ